MAAGRGSTPCSSTWPARCAAASGLRTCRRSSSAPRAGCRWCRRIEEQRRVVDHRGRREALFQRRRVDEGLEAGPRLPPGLRDVVELVLAEVEAAHQRADGAGARVHGHQGAFDLGQLGQRQSPLALAQRAPPRRGGSAPWGRPCRTGPRSPAQAVAGDGDRSRPTAAWPPPCGRGLQHHGRRSSSLSGWSARASATRASIRRRRPAGRRRPRGRGRPAAVRSPSGPCAGHGRPRSGRPRSP
jgi:hypothetical protein